MKNFLTFLLLAVIVVVVIVLIKKPATEEVNTNDINATIEAGSDSPLDPNMVGGDASVEAVIGGQGDTIQQ